MPAQGPGPLHACLAELPTWAEGDASRLQQIVGNLLANAVKFTDIGFVALTASAIAPQPDGAFTLVVEVRDTGIGIAPDVLPRLFEVFEQAEWGTARRYGGTGLGLAICRRLAEAMGGRVTLTSRLGQGSCFRLEVPLRPAAAPAAEPAPWAEPAGAARRLKILVADDVAVNLALFRALLATAGHQIVTVGNGAAAVEAARSEPFDIILLDIHMPEMDGPTAARQIRRGRDVNHATPILALTASITEEDAAAVRAAGMNAYLTKPIGRAALLAALAQHTGAAVAPA